MYCDYPVVSEQSRIRHLSPLEKNEVRISPVVAASLVGISQPDEARLSSVLSRPVFRFRSGDRIAVVYADSGEVFHGFQEWQARQVGAAWTHLRPEEAILETRKIQEDYSIFKADAMAHDSWPHLRLRDIHVDSERHVLNESDSLA